MLLLVVLAVAGMAQTQGSPTTLDLVNDAAKLPMKQRLEAGEKIIARARQSNDRPGEGLALSSVGYWLLEAGETSKALDDFKLSIAIYQEVHDLSRLAETECRAGMACQALSKPTDAVPYYESAVDNFKTCKNMGGAAEAIRMKANAVGQSDVKRAFPIYQEALNLNRSIGNRNGEAEVLLSIGRNWEAALDQKRAVAYFEQAISVYHALNNDFGEAEADFFAARDSLALGQVQKALDLNVNALALYRKAHDRRGEAETLIDIGGIRTLLKKPDEALSDFQQAAECCRAIEDHRGEAEAHWWIGNYYVSKNELDKALEAYRAAIPLYVEVGDRRAEAEAITSVGNIYLARGKPEQAIGLYNQAVPLFNSVGDLRGQGMALTFTGNTLIQLNKPDLAILTLKQAVNAYQGLRAVIYDLNPDQEKILKSSISATYRTLADLLIQQGRVLEAQRVLDLLKEDERFEFIRRDASAASPGAKLEFVGIERQWASRLDSIKDRAVSIGTELAGLKVAKAQAQRDGKPFPDETRLAKLEKDEAQVEADTEAFYALALSESKDQKQALAANRQKELEEFRNSVGEPLGELEAAAKVKVAAVYMLSVHEAVHFIVATPEGGSVISVSAPAETVNKLVGGLEQALTDPNSDPKPAGLALYQALIKPVRDQLQRAGISHTMWCLDGAMRYIPLGAIWDGSHYLVEDQTMTIFSPLELAKLSKERDPQPKIAGFGATLGGAFDGLSFPPLPNVRSEMGAIVRSPAKHFNGVVDGDPWLDSDFSENTLRTQMGDPYYRIAHIASHFELRGDFEKSALLTGDGHLISLKELLSGTGTVQSALVKKPWSHLDLVVLSACDTAGVLQTQAETSALGGSECDSFASLVLGMGASSVMASLWSVSDESTGMLMKRFYKNWVGGMTKSESLRSAQNAMLKGEIVPEHQGSGKPASFSHPYYWAPFLLYGNWR